MVLSYFNQILNLDIYFLISLIVNIFSLIFFLIIKEENKRKEFFLKILIFTILIFFFYSILLSTLQYFLWKKHPLSKFLLPPYQSIFYFLSYSFFNFFRDFIFRLLGLISVLLIFKLIIFSFKRDPFYEDEKYIIYLITLFFSFPYNFFIISLSFIILLLMAVLSLLFSKENNKYYSFRNFWLIYSFIFLLFEPLFFQKISFLIFFKP